MENNCNIKSLIFSTNKVENIKKYPVWIQFESWQWRPNINPTTIDIYGIKPELLINVPNFGYIYINVGNIYWEIQYNIIEKSNIPGDIGLSIESVVEI